MTVTDTGPQSLARKRAARQSYTAAVATEVRVQAARLDVTQAQIAQALGLATSGMSRRMTGDTPFDVEELAAIAVLLGCEVRDLLPGAYDGDPVQEFKSRSLPRLDSNQQPSGHPFSLVRPPARKSGRAA